jgi:hypothetical protein
MGLNWKNAARAGGKAKVPIEKFPEDDVFEAVLQNQRHGKSPNQVVRELLGKNPELLAEHKLTVKEHYPKPGQSMAGIRARFDHLVETDARWWQRAKGAGLLVQNPCPGTTAAAAELDGGEIPVDAHDAGWDEDDAPTTTDATAATPAAAPDAENLVVTVAAVSTPAKKIDKPAPDPAKVKAQLHREAHTRKSEARFGPEKFPVISDEEFKRRLGELDEG